MKCSYCGKRTSDMVNHLRKSNRCSREHAGKLNLQFKHILVEHKKVCDFFKVKESQREVRVLDES